MARGARLGWFAVAALLLAVALAGCEGDEITTTTTAPPPTPVPSPTPTPTPTPSPTPAPAPTPTPSPPPERSANYPLSQLEAQAIAQSGLPVAGRLESSWREVLILQSTETEQKQEPVQEEVCDYEYDYYEEKEVRKCRVETVYRDQPVTKTVYVVSVPGLSRVTRDSIASAFSYAYGLGTRDEWRRG